MRRADSPRLGFFLSAPLLLAAFTAFASDQPLKVGTLPRDKCVDTSVTEEPSDVNQRYWYRRKPPYVGFKGGEDLGAGGDGTCVLGFPKASEKSGTVMINGKVIKVIPIAEQSPGSLEYRSKDGLTSVQVVVTGRESTCAPEGGSCCGEYRFAKIRVQRDGQEKTVKVANYGGS